MTCFKCTKSFPFLNDVHIVIGHEEYLELLCNECRDIPRVKYLEQWHKAEYN